VDRALSAASTGAVDDMDLRSLVERATGATVVELAPHLSAFGSSRQAYVADTTRGRVFVRCAVPGLGLEATMFNLAREAAVVEALADAGFRVPRPLLVSADGRAVVVEWADGEVGLCGDADERERLARDYVQLIAEIAHADPATTLPEELRASPTVGTAVDVELARWRAIATPAFLADPLGSALLHWLEATAVRDDGPAVFVHGDAGHGNFLVLDHEVASLIDWELSHWGDPLEDLACMQMRSMGRDAQIWRTAIEASHRARGIRVDPERLAWERAHVLVRSAIAMQRSLEHGNEGRAEAPFARFKDENLLLALRQAAWLGTRGWAPVPQLAVLRREAERRCGDAGEPSVRLRGADVAFAHPEDL
jgi:aminoglycoside phosphotransferase (APT) family kinase protein